MTNEQDIWPEKLMLRDTRLSDDMGGLGQRIYTTAGAGYQKREYIRADLKDQWVKVSDHFPKTGEYVIAFLRNELGKGRRIRAYYTPRFTTEAGDLEYDDFAEYCEEKDQYYLPEGWYETNEYDENNWMVHDPVTHWVPLPESPRE